jgi:TPR repeat protein
MTIRQIAALALPLWLALAACKDKQESAPPPSAQTAAETPTAEPAAEAKPAEPAPSPADGCKDLRDNQGMAACEKACEAGVATACQYAGQLHIEEDDEATADAAALPFFQKGCEGNDGESCRMVGVFHRGGLAGLAKDETKMNELYAKAVPLFEKECEAGSKVSCNHAGDMLSAGEGVASDRPKAMTMWRKACDLGLPGACDRIKKEEGAAP